jgi:hypothetical protein
MTASMYLYPHQKVPEMQASGINIDIVLPTFDLVLGMNSRLVKRKARRSAHDSAENVVRILFEPHRLAILSTLQP